MINIFYNSGTAIIDNDDFKDDDLTGGETSHRTNMMFIQPQSYVKSNSNNHVNQPTVICDVERLKNLTKEEHKIHSYSTNSRGAPLPINAINVTKSSTSDEIRKKMFIHAARK